MKEIKWGVEMFLLIYVSILSLMCGTFIFVNSIYDIVEIIQSIYIISILTLVFFTILILFVKGGLLDGYKEKSEVTFIIIIFLFFLVCIMCASWISLSNLYSQTDLKEESFCKLKGYDHSLLNGYTGIKCFNESFNETTTQLYDISYYDDYEYPLNKDSLNWFNKLLLQDVEFI